MITEGVLKNPRLDVLFIMDCCCSAIGGRGGALSGRVEFMAATAPTVDFQTKNPIAISRGIISINDRSSKNRRPLLSMKKYATEENLFQDVKIFIIGTVVKKTRTRCLLRQTQR